MRHSQRDRFLQEEMPKLYEFISIHKEFRIIGSGLRKQIIMKTKDGHRVFEVSALYASKDWEQDILDFYNYIKKSKRSHQRKEYSVRKNTLQKKSK